MWSNTKFTAIYFCISFFAEKDENDHQLGTGAEAGAQAEAIKAHSGWPSMLHPPGVEWMAALRAVIHAGLVLRPNGGMDRWPPFGRPSMPHPEDAAWMATQRAHS